MSYRMQRVAGAVREVVSDAIANRLWDPRIHRLTTVTRVELSADLQIAKVYFSVIGTEREANLSLQGLQRARGVVQNMLAKRLEMRQCPELRFFLDAGMRQARETLRRLGEIRGAEEGGASADGAGIADETDVGVDGAVQDELADESVFEGPAEPAPDRAE